MILTDDQKKLLSELAEKKKYEAAQNRNRASYFAQEAHRQELEATAIEKVLLDSDE